MSTFGTFLDLGILWFLITLFTGSIDSDRSFREARIVAFGVKIIGFVCHAVLDKAFGAFERDRRARGPLPFGGEYVRPSAERR